MNRRSRLSRSRDFDAVYRHGRSVSSRYLVLYSFTRSEEAGPASDGVRLGLAVSRKVGGAVERNRVKRQLREAFEATRESFEPGRDYVLVVRPGLPGAAHERGFQWLVERVREVAEQARAREGASAS
jgi:ribonuclease P protein component